MSAVEHIAARSWHGRRDGPDNRFAYTVDYVLCDAEAPLRTPWGMGRNRPGLWALWDRDLADGTGAAWVRAMMAERQIDPGGRIEILTHPRVMGHVFNPVSFWLCYDGLGVLRLVVAEVSNTFGDRHAYLCHRDDHGPITREDQLSARKIFHVSPFQPIEGAYGFWFDLRPDRLAIRIELSREGGGLLATLAGPRRALRTRDVLWGALRRPFGARRVLALIHWQALVLWIKGARYRRHTPPPRGGPSR